MGVRSSRVSFELVSFILLVMCVCVWILGEGGVVRVVC